MKGYIYKIINKNNGNFYIGSTLKTPQERKAEHFYYLSVQKHHNFHLQNAYNKYGIDVFEFISKEVQIKNEEEIRLLEERYINYCWDSGLLYNLSKKGSGGDLISYHPNLDEIKKKHSENGKKRWASLSDEEKKVYCEKYKGEKNPNFNNRWNSSQRQKLSNIKKEYFKTHVSYQQGKTFEEIFGKEKAKILKTQMSERGKLRTGAKNPFYGKHHTEKTKQIIKEKNSGKSNPTCRKQVIYNGIIYDSATDCSKKLNIPMVTVAYRARNGIYGFAYVGETEDKQREAYHKWTKEECEELASNCKTIKEFVEKYPKASNFARRESWYKELKEKYFIELRHYWTIEEILDLCSQVNSYTELRKQNPQILPVLNRRKDIKEKVKEYFNLKNNENKML